ncbi:MAG TPA: hypothetical protein VFL19_00620 [Nitrospira sp.]|nr:hypothetical protein [Nitrospira sp.]
MTRTPQDAYQLAGLDARDRGFSRTVEVMVEDRRYRVALRYEAAHIVTEPAESHEAALQLLIEALHGQGYRQLKTQVSFRSGTYVGSGESWVEYPDPPQPAAGLLAVIRQWFQRNALSA